MLLDFVCEFEEAREVVEAGVSVSLRVRRDDIDGECGRDVL